MKNHTIQMRLDDALFKRLSEYATKKEESNSAVIRAALDAFLPPLTGTSIWMKEHKCRSCGASPITCDHHVWTRGRGCCSACYSYDTHKLSLHDWKEFRDSQNEQKANMLK